MLASACSNIPPPSSGTKATFLQLSYTLSKRVSSSCFVGMPTVFSRSGSDSKALVITGSPFAADSKARISVFRGLFSGICSVQNTVQELEK